MRISDPVSSNYRTSQLRNPKSPKATHKSPYRSIARNLDTFKRNNAERRKKSYTKGNTSKRKLKVSKKNKIPNERPKLDKKFEVLNKFTSSFTRASVDGKIRMRTTSPLKKTADVSDAEISPMMRVSVHGASKGRLTDEIKIDSTQEVKLADSDSKPKRRSVFRKRTKQTNNNLQPKVFTGKFF